MSSCVGRRGTTSAAEQFAPLFISLTVFALLGSLAPWNFLVAILVLIGGMSVEWRVRAHREELAGASWGYPYE